MTPLEEAKTISKIANRSIENGDPRVKMHIVLDLEFVQSDCPLDLSGLLAANNGDFVHDLCGIAENMNRHTHKLENGFVPRFAV